MSYSQRARIVGQIRQIESGAVRDGRELTAFELATIDLYWREVDAIEARFPPRVIDPQPSATDSDWTAPA